MIDMNIYSPHINWFRYVNVIVLMSPRSSPVGFASASLDLSNMAAALTCLCNGSKQSMRRLCQYFYGSYSIHFHVTS